MDESKILIPPWLPWATTACLAALVACLGELWIVEKARVRLMNDQNLLAEAALKGAQNQLEAERILEARELGVERAPRNAGIGFNVGLLSPAAGGAASGTPHAPPWGVVIWESGGNRAFLKFSGLMETGPEQDYQIWVDGPAKGYPAACGVFGASAAEPAPGIAMNLAFPVVPGCRFLIIQGRKGGEPSLGEAMARGSIVLATLPYSGKISNR